MQVCVHLDGSLSEMLGEGIVSALHVSKCLGMPFANKFSFFLSEEIDTFFVNVFEWVKYSPFVSRGPGVEA